VVAQRLWGRLALNPDSLILPSFARSPLAKQSRARIPLRPRHILSCPYLHPYGVSRKPRVSPLKVPDPTICPHTLMPLTELRTGPRDSRRFPEEPITCPK